MRVKEMWASLSIEIPISILRFVILCYFIQHNLAITDKAERVLEKAKDILTRKLYADFYKSINLRKQ